MAHNETEIDVGIGKVFELLLDPATYPAWVAGTKRLTWYDDEWPAPGSCFWVTYAGGLRKARTEVVDLQAPKRIVLRINARPFAIIRSEIELQAHSNSTHVSLVETLERPRVPHRLRRFTDYVMHARNAEALRRLKLLAEGGEEDAEE